MSMFFTNVP